MRACVHANRGKHALPAGCTSPLTCLPAIVGTQQPAGRVDGCGEGGPWGGASAGGAGLGSYEQRQCTPGSKYRSFNALFVIHMDMDGGGTQERVSSRTPNLGDRDAAAADVLRCVAFVHETMRP